MPGQRKENLTAFIGFAFPDAMGQWGAPRRYDYLPALPRDILDRSET